MMMENSVKSTPLPAEKMPKCWLEDEDRMNALFSPFRSANPQDWKSKYEFWRGMIDEWSKHTLCCSFSLQDLNETFKRKGCSPLALPTVVQQFINWSQMKPKTVTLTEMYRNEKEIGFDRVSEANFCQESSESWAAWTIDLLVKKPVSWSFCTLKSYMIGDTINSDEKFVYFPSVKLVGELVISTIVETDKENILLPVSEVLKDCRQKNPKITEKAVRLALIWLKRARKATFKDNSLPSDMLVKIDSNSVKKISQIDEGLHDLKKQEEKLLKDVELMENKKESILSEAKSCVAAGKKQLAKTHLRRKAKLEEAIEKRAQVLENVQTLICQIQDSHSSLNVLAAYKVGVDVLKEIKQSGLTEDNVRDVMDDVSEGIQDQQMVETVLSESVRSVDSDSDLEKELEELMSAEAEIHEGKQVESLESLEKRLSMLYVNDLPSPVQETYLKPSAASRKKEGTAKQLETAS